ncbi:hypothetical protein BK146_29235 [Paenibacillus sp. FSL R7-0333]|nr:hypothetical protein BK146_29235 [Paenibacillus sp. FSL R7-0333]
MLPPEAGSSRQTERLFLIHLELRLKLFKLLPPPEHYHRHTPVIRPLGRRTIHYYRQLSVPK